MGHVERRKRETLLQFMWHMTDVVAVVCAFMGGYWLRFYSPLVGGVWDLDKGIPPLKYYMVAAAATSLVWIVVFHAFDLYKARSRWDGRSVVTLLKASILGIPIPL